MGRGRAKAKQTKVARQLKYNSGGTDLSRLANELGSSSTSIGAVQQPVQQPQPPNGEPFEDDEDDDDPYARYADLYNSDDDDDDEDEGQSPHQHQHRRGA
jgi:hypothetical protein